MVHVTVSQILCRLVSILDESGYLKVCKSNILIYCVHYRDGTSIVLSDDVGQIYFLNTGQGESQKDSKYDQVVKYINIASITFYYLYQLPNKFNYMVVSLIFLSVFSWRLSTPYSGYSGKCS